MRTRRAMRQSLVLRWIKPSRLSAWSGVWSCGCISCGAAVRGSDHGLTRAASLERRLATVRSVGQSLAQLSAWAVLALASGEGSFPGHVAGLLSDPDRSRARSRLRQQDLADHESFYQSSAKLLGGDS